MMIQSTQLYGFVVVAGLLMAKNQRNLRLIKELRLFKALYNCKETFTDVMKTLQIKLFLQNKANFQKVKFDVNIVLTKDYDQMDTWSIRKTKPIQSQFKPNTKPIQTQLKPKQTQFKAKQTQFHGSIMLNCAICSANTSTCPGKFRESADTYYDRENTLENCCKMAMIMPNVAYTTFWPKGNSNSRSKYALEVETIQFGGKSL